MEEVGWLVSAYLHPAVVQGAPYTAAPGIGSFPLLCREEIIKTEKKLVASSLAPAPSLFVREYVRACCPGSEMVVREGWKGSWLPMGERR